MTDLSTPTNDGQSTESLITQHIDIWTTAIERKSSAGRGTSNKFSLYGIKKLRELILELAVRGKLVPQDVNDKPASVLLESIAAEKMQLVKEGKLKKQKPFPEICDDEKPFELPQGWEWIRLGDYAQIFSGNAFKSGDFSSELGVKSIKITNAGVGHLIETDEFLPKEFLDIYHAFLVKKDDLILALTRPYISDGLKVSMCPESYHNSLLNQRVAAIRAYLNPEFAFFILRSPYVLNTYKNRFGGSGLQPNLKMSDVTDLLIPICSEQEQYRIVAKVDQLMSLCDALEAQTEASIAAHQTLVETLLNALLLPNTTQPAACPEHSLIESLASSPEPSFADSLEPALNESFVESWQRVAEHFDTLFTTEASIDTLKQTILQLAVMGKLVPQDANDEPAAKLLQRIAAEKAQLIKDGKIKKQKPLPAITDEEKPFELPKGWEWCRFDDTALSSSAGWSPQCIPTPREGDNWGVLKVSAVTWGQYNPEENKELPSHLEPRLEHEVQSGDFLISRANTADLVAKAVVVPELAPKNLMMSDKIIRFKLHGSVSGEYLNLMNNSQVSRDYYNRVAGGTSSSMKNVSREHIRSLVVALPPLEEQHHIVARVEELMTLCDQLKARLSDAQTTQLHLTDAIVEQAL
jgi:type I restriction enzyme S subunit